MNTPRTWFAIALLVAALGGLVLGYARTNQSPDQSASENFGEYGYRCGDGSEFTMIPTVDMMSIALVPATSVDYIRETTLVSVPSERGARYEGGGVTFSAVGETVTIDTEATEPTTCTPMMLPDEAPFNFGD